MRIITALTFLFIFCGPAFAKSAKEVDAALTKYRKASAVSSKVTKTVVNELMGTDNQSSGNFYYSKGKLRLDFTEPERTTLVYDGKFVWLESRMDDQKIQVTKMRTNELKKSKSVLTALFDKKDVLRNFKLTKSRNDNGLKVFTFAPKDKKSGGEVTMLEVALKGKDIERITYVDEVENKVSFIFSGLTRGEVPAAKFSYKPPKNAEVTEI